MLTGPRPVDADCHGIRRMLTVCQTAIQERAPEWPFAILLTHGSKLRAHKDPAGPEARGVFHQL